VESTGTSLSFHCNGVENEKISGVGAVVELEILNFAEFISKLKWAPKENTKSHSFRLKFIF
jgi:hypothetical protein